MKRICRGCHKPTVDLSGTCATCRQKERRHWKAEARQAGPSMWVRNLEQKYKR